MPKTLQLFFDEAGIKANIDQYTVDNFTLTDHATSLKDDRGQWERLAPDSASPTVEKILSKEWNEVILQEFQIFPLIKAQRLASCQPAICFLDSVIKLKGGKTILFEGYVAQKRYFLPKNYCKLYFNMEYFDMNIPKKMFTTKEFVERIKDSLVCTDSFNSSAEEEIELQLEYNRMAQKVGASVAHVGYCFELCKIKHPSIHLFNEVDNFHPSKQGSYLIACVFYKFLTGNNLNKIKYSAGVNEEEAKEIRELIDDIPMKNE